MDLEIWVGSQDLDESMSSVSDRLNESLEVILNPTGGKYSPLADSTWTQSELKV